MRWAIWLLVLASYALGCSEASGPGAERFVLATVNGTAVPLPYPGFEFLEVVSGEITLRANGTMSDVLVVRCASVQPPGATCQVANGGRTERAGTYSREAGWVRLDDTEYPAAFTGAGVVITFRSVSSGLIPAVHEYRRN